MYEISSRSVVHVWDFKQVYIVHVWDFKQVYMNIMLVYNYCLVYGDFMQTSEFWTEISVEGIQDFMPVVGPLEHQEKKYLIVCK